MPVATKKIAKPKGGKRPGAGRKPGYRHYPETIERIRDSINAGLAVSTLHELCEGADEFDSVRATAALGLLRFKLPQLSATDHTSGGEPITIERVSFKRTTEKAK
jgi:hypothetical protein